ncbi:hypothetical protein [Streptomyces sp. NBC_01408]|uniref:hypothetical protein n=1 Tax=Streptomyces sp. NBC_01408 TaxID=2903855 RepID=UPI0022585111|nr:hypothetical protein [Streptomyces sp. NBC_01408]MCX4696296.1 hypothetical protein [Streptomyces sp. NBC_01408]
MTSIFGVSVILSGRIVELISREFDGDFREKIIADLAGVDESTFGVQDLERIAGAIVILCKQGIQLDVALDVARSDWRDLLMASGLAGDDWQAVLEREFSR